jgi:hypothetical protein
MIEAEIHQRAIAATKFAEARHIHLAYDMQADPKRFPQLMPVSEDEHTTLLVNEAGAEYEFSQIDYINRYDLTETLARRMVAVIPAGKRTELAFWKPNAPLKRLTIHCGLGQLLVAAAGKSTVESFELAAESSPVKDSVEAGNFYTLMSNVDSRQPLVVSGFYTAPFDNWANLEIPFAPEAASIMSDDEIVAVPSQFSWIFRA